MTLNTTIFNPPIEAAFLYNGRSQHPCKILRRVQLDLILTEVDQGKINGTSHRNIFLIEAKDGYQDWVHPSMLSFKSGSDADQAFA